MKKEFFVLTRETQDLTCIIPYNTSEEVISGIIKSFKEYSKHNQRLTFCEYISDEEISDIMKIIIQNKDLNYIGKNFAVVEHCLDEESKYISLVMDHIGITKIGIIKDYTFAKNVVLNVLNSFKPKSEINGTLQFESYIKAPEIAHITKKLVLEEDLNYIGKNFAIVDLS